MNFKNREAFLKVCRQFYFDLVDLNAGGGSGSGGSGVEMLEHGRIRREFAQFLRPLFKEAFGENGKLLPSLSESELKERLNALSSRVRDFHMKEGNLGDYSPWLKNFKRNLAKDLEIPGTFSIVNEQSTPFRSLYWLRKKVI